MGDPLDAEFERRTRRLIHERYKQKAKANRELIRLLSQAHAKIQLLEYRLAEQAELVELAERIISDGTVDGERVEVAGVDAPAPG